MYGRNRHQKVDHFYCQYRLNRLPFSSDNIYHVRGLHPARFHRIFALPTNNKIVVPGDKNENRKYINTFLNIKPLIMKQKFLFSLLVAAAGIMPAVASDPVPAPARVILNAGNIEHVHVLSNMEIILLQSPQDEHSIVFGEQASQNLDIRLNHKTLSISQRKANSKSKTIVYLYVNNLKSLSVEGDTDVKTVGSLETGKLDVFVDGNAKVHIRTTGTVKAHSLNNSELEVKYLKQTDTAKRAY